MTPFLLGTAYLTMISSSLPPIRLGCCLWRAGHPPTQISGRQNVICNADRRPSAREASMATLFMIITDKVVVKSW